MLYLWRASFKKCCECSVEERIVSCDVRSFLHESAFLSCHKRSIMKLFGADCGFVTASVHTYSVNVMFERVAGMRTVMQEGEKEHKAISKVMANSEEYQHGKEAEEMPNIVQDFQAVNLVGLLKACAMQKDLHKASRAHAEVIKTGLLGNVIVYNSLVNMYAKCGALKRAQQMFYDLPARTLVSWNVLIAGFAQNGHAEQALDCFEQMQQEGFSPDAITFACILKACGIIGSLNKVQDIHLEMIREGLLKTNIMAANALLDMYAKCGLLFKAEKVFKELPIRDVVSWTTLIGAYAQHGHGEEALHCFERMEQEGLAPNVVTFVGILRVCGMTGALGKGQEIHARTVKEGFIAQSIVLGTVLIDMYAKCGMFSRAEAVMSELAVRNVVSWTALITGYAQQGQSERALLCFELMQHEKVSPNAITFICILKSCSSLGAMYRGQQIHSELVEKDLLEDQSIRTALLDMYAKSGMLSEAQDVFDELLVQDVASWNALLAGYAQLGNDKVIFKLIERMMVERWAPDVITLTIVLNACSHLGLIDEGQMYFLTMSTIYGISPTLEHHTCLIDLFGSAGQLDRAVSMIMEMPFLANAAVWHTMLGACQRWGDVNLGTWAFEHAAQLDDNDTAAYVLMSNISVSACWGEDKKECPHNQ